MSASHVRFESPPPDGAAAAEAPINSGDESPNQPSQVESPPTPLGHSLQPDGGGVDNGASSGAGTGPPAPNSPGEIPAIIAKLGYIDALNYFIQLKHKENMKKLLAQETAEASSDEPRMNTVLMLPPETKMYALHSD